MTHSTQHGRSQPPSTAGTAHECGCASLRADIDALTAVVADGLSGLAHGLDVVRQTNDHTISLVHATALTVRAATGADPYHVRAQRKTALRFIPGGAA
jgi:hypothetical protein